MKKQNNKRSSQPLKLDAAKGRFKPVTSNRGQAKRNINDLIEKCKERNEILTVEPVGVDYYLYWDERRLRVNEAACRYAKNQARAKGVLLLEALEGWSNRD